MRTASLKLLFGVILTVFPVAISSFPAYCRKTIGCSCISEDLPITEVTPIKYNLTITINPSARILSGEATILINIEKSLVNISLHVHELEVDEQRTNITLNGMLISNLMNVTYCKEKDILILIFDNIIQSGQYNLNIKYASILNNSKESDFYSPIWIEENQKWMFTNLYVPNAIRGIFPCWDNPAVKASFNILIKHPIGYTALTNAPIQSTSFEPLIYSNMQLTQFEEIFSMPTSLMGIVVVKDIRDSKRGIHTVWHKVDTKNTSVLNIALITMLYLFHQMRISWLNIVSKVDHVVLPNSPVMFIGKPGLVIYREKDVDGDSVLSGRAIDITTLIGYQMARQLFLGSVSPNLHSDDHWLNEILASFYSYYVTSKIWPENYRLMELFVVKIIQPALDSDIYIETEPIMHKIKNTDGIDALLYPLLYHKKAFALIRMLYHIFTPKIFEEAIEKYVHTSTKNLMTVLEDVKPHKESSGYTIKEIMNTWLTIKHHPELHVFHDYKGTSLIYKLYYMDEWKIPISLITQSNMSYDTSTIIWIQWNNETKVISSVDPRDFYIINVFGYYRVNYDINNWNKISSQLQTNFKSIPALNRAQLINDAYYFVTTNKLETSYFLDIIAYLKLETDFIAWYPMFNILSHMSTFFELSESENVKRHFSAILEEVLEIIGYEEYPDDNLMKRPLQLLARQWACKLSNLRCWKAAANKLITYLRNYELNKIPQTSKDWILCKGLMGANVSFWNEVRHQIIEVKNIEYLACFEDAKTIVYYLSMMLKEKTFQPMEQIYRSVVKKHVKKNDVLQFLLNNYDEIKLRFPIDFSGGNLLSDMIMNVYTKEQLDKIYNFAYNRYSWSGKEPASFNFEMLINARKTQLSNVLNKFAMLKSIL